jgi:hypothetical protein
MLENNHLHFEARHEIGKPMRWSHHGHRIKPNARILIPYRACQVFVVRHLGRPRDCIDRPTVVCRTNGIWIRAS